MLPRDAHSLTSITLLTWDLGRCLEWWITLFEESDQDGGVSTLIVTVIRTGREAERGCGAWSVARTNTRYSPPWIVEVRRKLLAKRIIPRAESIENTPPEFPVN